jgi:hypothetical protein
VTIIKDPSLPLSGKAKKTTHYRKTIMEAKFGVFFGSLDNGMRNFSDDSVTQIGIYDTFKEAESMWKEVSWANVDDAEAQAFIVEIINGAY